MAPWLRRTTWFQRVALFLVLAALVLLVYRLATGSDSPIGTIILATLIALVAFRKPLLWRVRNRLLITYLLLAWSRSF
jgi:hypothetical protein